MIVDNYQSKMQRAAELKNEDCRLKICGAASLWDGLRHAADFLKKAIVDNYQSKARKSVVSRWSLVAIKEYQKSKIKMQNDILKIKN